MKRKPRLSKSLRALIVNVGVENGKLVYTDANGLPADPLYLVGPRTGEAVFIFWWATDENSSLTITFRGASPFSAKQFTSHNGMLKARVREGAYDRFKYDIVLVQSGTAYPADPQIIIS